MTNPTPEHSSPTTPSDTLIIGGGIIGLSCAYFLALMAPGLRITVIERDPGYEWASTPRASGGCRIQFSCPENIAMSLFSIDFIRQAGQHLSTPDHPAEVGWVEGGYLFIVPPEHIALLQSNHATQKAMGCEVLLLDPAALGARFPDMRVDDLGAGVLSPRDGWCDPHALLQALRHKALSMGVQLLRDEVVAIETGGHQVRALQLASGRRLIADQVVNAAGAWAGQVAALAGMHLPVSPLKRYEHYFTCGQPMQSLPYVKDLARMAFRSEGRGFSGGVVDGDQARGVDFTIDHGYFERVVWPAVAHRFPPLEAARCQRTWAGLYEQSELDGNPVIGPWAGGLDNFHTCAGFSGHGMMHAPAAGRAIAERILHGRDLSIDLGALGYERVLAQRPYRERGIL